MCVCRSREFTTFLTKEGRGLIAFHLVFGSSVYHSCVPQCGCLQRVYYVYSVFALAVYSVVTGCCQFTVL